jgi:hypothetical protein
MKRGDVMLAAPAPRLLVVLIEPLPGVDGWRCYSPKYKETYSFWEHELETR